MRRSASPEVTRYVALLRAMNVAGTGKLPMAELRRIGADCGFDNVRTYIASGNLLFESDLGEDAVRDRIAAELERFFGRPVLVHIRTAEELAAIVAANPFPDENGSRMIVFFLDRGPTTDLLAEARGQRGERMALGTRELYVAYGDGIRDTKLVIPATKTGTARNINTVTKLAELAAAPQ